ncbi:hypothetical protein [Coxiella-like endosymbiont of Rhipicephalus sanguineus]|uniref:hypothetical protein n=1 Tax=Coxiella-like endosymbiont of Rhipicephalus sanguineus TaxID=1955402 RepID=UPI00203E5694|nr:hypothetical protein [Coxiella-like endosymbiont of Rhipicephalus sanguineus]
MHTPLIIYWPSKKAEINYRTSHYDVIPTLMQGALNCQNGKLWSSFLTKTNADYRKIYH